MADSRFLSLLPNGISPKNPIALICGPPKFMNSAAIDISKIRYGGNSNSECSASIRHSHSAVRAPAAPWMRNPLLVKPSELLDLSKSRSKKKPLSGRNGERIDLDLSSKVGNGRNKLAMKQIFRGIENLQESQYSEETGRSPEKIEFRFRPGDLFGNQDDLNADEVERSDGVSGINEFCIPIREVAGEEVRSKKLPWQRDEGVVVGRINRAGSVKKTKLNNIDEILLERLRSEAAKMRKWVKVKKLGVTQAVVNEVHFTWKSSELVLLKFDVPLSRYMSRAREIVELKTGGISIWRSKDFIAVYRGCSYEPNANHPNIVGDVALSSSSLYQKETDRLLDELGPRFVDWWMHKPLPVDADLLPELVPELKPPYRMCPPFTRPQLADAELTYLRKHARPLPTHFVLGRNRRLQGLASAILKLWEKCHIAKIALKWGVPNTDNERMADELRRLTGGVLLLRNKFLILLYRGKDFLPSKVAQAVAARELQLSRSQQQEEAARLKASEAFLIAEQQLSSSVGVGTLSEFHSIHALTHSQDGIQSEAAKKKLEKELKNQQKKLFILKGKIEKSNRELKKIQGDSRFCEPDPDVEIIISNEEIQSLRNIGLRNDNRLVLGRRGVYNGVIEGMHQHWKHREIVKVITVQKQYWQIMRTANNLEAESGGIVISVVKLKHGHAILVYRGKNYRRPKCVAINLPNKRDALSRSIESQRLGSLKFFARQREITILDLKHKLADLSNAMIGETSG